MNSKITIVSLIVLLVLVLGGIIFINLGSEVDDERGELNDSVRNESSGVIIGLEREAESIVEANNKFAVDYYKKVMCPDTLYKQ